MSQDSGLRNTSIVGLQWGDEGKGKFVDVLVAEHDVVVRFNGGANAGHSGARSARSGGAARHG